jgi:phosphoribosylanthranilate isomerase
MKIKVCGITREEDIVKLLEIGVDFIGFNLLKESKRKVNIDWALEMTQKYQLKHKSVFLVDCEQPEFQRLTNVTSHNLQIYNFLEIPIVSNTLFIPVNATFLKQLEQPHSRNKKNHRYLIDNMEGALGGTGEKFDWSNLHKFDLSEVMLAGGIGTEDINFLKDLNVWGIDVNSKFETAPGIKNHDLLNNLRNVNE